MLKRSQDSFRMEMGRTSISCSTLHTSESILGQMTLASTTTQDKHNSESDVKGETLSRLSQHPRVNTDSQDSSTPSLPGGEDSRWLGSSSSLNFSGGAASPSVSVMLRGLVLWQPVSRCLIHFFQTLWQGLHFVNTARHI